ncbi:uncharacterized protein CLUP02_02905 [Colletotrichum lupini]|uniref:Uncharacterized protein n=1 Tax=Colletotrichum lupini TaxID=145971 RepID=A0A9Q8WC79_9PEZI|nr:uncharacterized protein CLUP02_02905 [Colletotrichum lupini]UQC77437.1 hypothetical protein CLUP02_02905 [Colletotrichum lupini]
MRLDANELDCNDHTLEVVSCVEGRQLVEKGHILDALWDGRAMVPATPSITAARVIKAPTITENILLGKRILRNCSAFLRFPVSRQFELAITFTMADAPPSTIVGCLLEVSASMREALETDDSDERAADRLTAVLRTALKLAQSQNYYKSEALIFVSVSALITTKNTRKQSTYAKLPMCYSDLLPIHVLKKISDGQARIIDACLTRHLTEIDDPG